MHVQSPTLTERIPETKHILDHTTVSLMLHVATKSRRLAQGAQGVSEMALNSNPCRPWLEDNPPWQNRRFQDLFPDIRAFRGLWSWKHCLACALRCSHWTCKDPQFGPLFMFQLKSSSKPLSNAQKWTMTLHGTFAQEIIAKPDPPDRQRAPGSPAFFKPCRGGDRLPALIKILHSIPMGREALLCRGGLPV